MGEEEVERWTKWQMGKAGVVVTLERGVRNGTDESGPTQGERERDQRWSVS